MNKQQQYLQDIRSLTDIRQQLFDKQVDRLQAEAEVYKDSIEEVRQYEFKFSHPTVKWKSVLGPVLAHKNNFLYVYSAKDGVLKFDLLNDHREYPSSFEELVKEGGFEEAIAGFKSIDTIYQHHTDELRLAIRDLESQLKTYE